MSDNPFVQYRRKQIAQLRRYVPGESMDRISITDADREAGSPKEGDMIARNPANHDDKWLVAAEYFQNNFAPLEEEVDVDQSNQLARLQITVPSGMKIDYQVTHDVGQKIYPNEIKSITCNDVTWTIAHYDGSLEEVYSDDLIAAREWPMPSAVKEDDDIEEDEVMEEDDGSN